MTCVCADCGLIALERGLNHLKNQNTYVAVNWGFFHVKNAIPMQYRERRMWMRPANATQRDLCHNIFVGAMRTYYPTASAIQLHANVPRDQEWCLLFWLKTVLEHRRKDAMQFLCPMWRRRTSALFTRRRGAKKIWQIFHLKCENIYFPVFVCRAATVGSTYTNIITRRKGDSCSNLCGRAFVEHFAWKGAIHDTK